jgi:hypothetical protein
MLLFKERQSVTCHIFDLLTVTNFLKESSSLRWLETPYSSQLDCEFNDINRSPVQLRLCLIFFEVFAFLFFVSY